MTRAGTCILGIDPGVSGAMALFNPATGGISIHDFDTYKKDGSGKRRLDLYQLAATFEILAGATRVVYLEQVGSMPRQGISSAFAFGQTYGAIQMAIASAGLSLVEVPPSVWKRATRCPKDKDGARARASSIFPKHAHEWALKSQDGRAEAALIAWYGQGHLTLHGHGHD